MKEIKVIFENENNNYITFVNEKIDDIDIIKYFKNKWFNLGSINDKMKYCIDVIIKDKI